MRPWPDPRPVLACAQALFLSSDDVAGWEARAIELYQEVPLGALTFADKGAVLFVNGERHAVPAAPRTRSSRPGPGTCSPRRSSFATTRAATRSRPPRTRRSRGRSPSRPGIAGVPTAERLAGRWRAAQPR